MPRLKKDYRETLQNLQIHTKTGRVNWLKEVADAWFTLYPHKADWFMRQLRYLREVTTDGYYSGKTGHMYVKTRVPTELLMYLQRWDPDFGRDSADMELLAKVWEDLVRAGSRARDRRKRTRLWSVTGVKLAQPTRAKEHGEKAEVCLGPDGRGCPGSTCQRCRDCEEQRRRDAGVAGVSEAVVPHAN